MDPKKVFRAADDGPVEQVPPAANPEASRLTNLPPPAAVATPKVPQAEGRGAWAWASDELKEKIRAAFRDEARASEPSPATKFGAAFGFGAIGLGETLGLSTSRKLENLEATQSDLAHRVLMLEASSPRADGDGPAESAKPKATKSRRGSKRRDGGLTCEEQMLLLAEADRTVIMLKPPGIHDRMVARWGKDNAFCIRTIQDQPLYRAWQFEVEKLRKGLDMSPADFAEEGLAILSHKPGREDKRRVGRAQYEQRTRMFLAAIENINIGANREIEAIKAARNQRGRQ